MPLPVTPLPASSCIHPQQILKVADNTPPPHGCELRQRVGWLGNDHRPLVPLLPLLPLLLRQQCWQPCMLLLLWQLALQAACCCWCWGCSQWQQLPSWLCQQLYPARTN
jgi:hypothetical protein